MLQNTIVTQLTGKSGALAASTEEELKEQYKDLVITLDFETARGRASSQRGHASSRSFLRKDEEIEIHGDRLPHWNQANTYVFFTFRLGDSLPKEKQEEIKLKREVWMKANPLPWDDETKREYHRTFTHKVEEWLDNGFGSCILKDQKASSIVVATMQHDDGKKYDLIDYVIMPNHVHALVRMIGDTKVEDLMQQWKSISSHKLRKQFGSEWCGWMENWFPTRTFSTEEMTYRQKAPLAPALELVKNGVYISTRSNLEVKPVFATKR